ncbi:SusC/RagA family TonB-linked outer membrane protein [Filimonas lacunae]|nr:SusC/RagA family TonB-linked outer membrane protein [Filimonas lacunae]BAV04691.1 outer membrane protein [Filimonas lacunae]
MAKMTFVLLFVATLQVGARSIGQTMTASFNNAGLNEVFREVEKQTGYTFVFSKVQMQQAGKVTALFKSTPLPQALKEIFKDQPFTFQVSDKYIVVQQKSAEGMSASLNSAMAPPDAIKGKVTDEAGNPISGAIVTVKGTHIQTYTNERGEFQLKDVTAEATLVISSLNIETKEVPLKGRTEITLVTKAKIFALEDVSIGNFNYGYGTISKDRAAGAASKISDSALASTPTISLIARLEGVTPGLKVDNKNNKLLIRTTNNYTSGSEPLIVIDGFPQVPVGDQQSLIKGQGGNVANNALYSYVNPNDIESITVLKDASATSIWGSRGANGVIVIETKKGKKGNASINFSSNVGVSRPANLNKLRWMTSAQYIDLEQELVDKGYAVDPLANGTPSIWTYNNSEASEWIFKYKRGTITQAERDAALAKLSSYDSRQQIKDYLLQSAVNQQYNISASGGSDNSTYYVSGNYTRDRPVFRSNDAQSASITGNITSNLIKQKLTFKMGFNYVYAVSKTNTAAVDALSVSTTALRPYDLLVDESGNTIKRDPRFRSEITTPLVAKGYLPFTYNAIDQLNYSNTVGKDTRVRINMDLNYKFNNWLNMDVYGMYQSYNTTQTLLDELNSYVTRYNVNYGTTVNTAGKLVYGYPYGGVLTTNLSSGYDYNMRAQINLNKRISGDHQVVALAATEIRETFSTGDGYKRYGFNSETLTSQAINPLAPYNTMDGYTSQLSNPLLTYSESKKRYLSYLGNFSYLYKEKYIATGSMRFDDYTMMGLDRQKRAKPFWSAGLRWNASREAFMQDVKFLNDLNVRLTYGTSGSVPLAGTNIPLISISGTDSRTQQPIGNIQTPANQQLGWETTKTLNGGVGASFFNNRLTATVDIYSKRSYGIMYSLPFNPTYGWSSVTFNTATMSSHGFEFGLTGHIFRKKDWGWTSTFNFSYGTNKVTDSRFPSNSSNLVPGGTPLVGYSIGNLFVYKWAGLDNKGQSQIYDGNGKIVSSTEYTNTFTIKDVKYAGTTIAPYYGGFFNTFHYKSFTFDVHISYYMGHVFLRQSVDNYPNFIPFTGVLDRNADLATRWRKPGDEATTNVPGLSNMTYNSWLRYKNSDVLVEKGDNIRLQQISLSYSVPVQYLPKGIFKSLSVSANARNLGLIWTANKKGLDPEYLNTGSYTSLRPATNYVFGLQATF